MSAQMQRHGAVWEQQEQEAGVANGSKRRRSEGNSELSAFSPVRLGDLQLCMSGFDESDGAALTVKSVISW